MKLPRTLLRRAGRVLAGINVLFTIGSAVKPPDPQLPAPTQEVQVQWAKHEKARLEAWRTRAGELGQQLREPAAGEYRPRERTDRGQESDEPGQPAMVRDDRDEMLSKGPARGRAFRAGHSGARERGRER
ncbi:hypothetical protein ASD62_03365 [Phycicoccus sp. Root563]|uniref:hypothetical protein n=1 Tax=Phycicoccus sp. Root563 TaxID=1736562 RepID=UPI0007027932|nr:hypothetical protein [Phycicoccus sp. Root563]KQZ88497.1 hypothetical protein ASD62_03365 [Phycicoccus sp. Root563]